LFSQLIVATVNSKRAIGDAEIDLMRRAKNLMGDSFGPVQYRG
jgi:hypothetical protein